MNKEEITFFQNLILPERVKSLYYNNKRYSKKDIYDEDLITLVKGTSDAENQILQFKAMNIIAGSQGPQKADLTITINGEEKTTSVTGNGPVDATFNAIQALYPHEDVKLQLYQVHAVTEGTDAQGEVTVRLEMPNGDLINGHGADTDVIVASCIAYLDALNRIAIKGDTPSHGALMATI